MSENRFLKDPDAALDYARDWSDWLEEAEVIESSIWIIAPGGVGSLTVDLEELEGGLATIWLSDGTAGVTYAVTNRISTSLNRTDDRTFYVKVAER